MDVIKKLKEISISENGTKKVIADYILSEKEKVLSLSMQEIANKTYTSKTSLFRFATSLGYKGWKEFIISYLKEQNYIDTNFSAIDPNIPFDNINSSVDIVKRLTKIQVESLQDTASKIDIKNLNRAAKLLTTASGKICLFGISPNNLIGYLFKRKMASIGYLVYVAPSDESGMIASLMTKNDCAILTSYSGNNPSRDPMMYIPTLKRNEVNIVGITSENNNYLRSSIECILTISSREDYYNKIGNFTTEESIMHIFNILYAKIFSEDYLNNYIHKIKISKHFEKRNN